jgi:predicted TIM-barrel fold metal-dependent hydrolase
VIVDVHTHTPRFRERVPAELRGQVEAKWSPGGARPTVYTWDEYLAALAPVDRAICFNIAADPRDPGKVVEPYVVPAPTVNDETAAFVNAHPEKFIGFASVHPHDPGALDELDRATGELGLRGVKFGHNYQNSDPLSEEAFRIYRYAEERRLPVLFHQGTSPVRFADLDYTHPRHVDRIATAFPNLTIVMAHIGHPWQIDCICVIRKHPNVWADISGSVLRRWGHYQAMVAALEWGVLDKLLFASDFPASTPEESLRLLRAVNESAAPGMPRIPEEKIEAIVGRDSLGLLGLG